MSSFTDEQRAAINAPIDHPVAIVACPGSGKTFTIIHRIAHLVSSGIAPDQLLVITFTRKAAQELRERLRNLGVDVKKLTVATFHSFGRSVLTRYGSLVGLPSFRLLSEAEQFQILLEYLPEAAAANKKDVLLRLQIYKATRKCTEDNLTDAFNRYQKRIKDEKLVDFTDLITFPLEIFRNNPDVLHYYQRKYQYALVDEMQDVSRAQFDLIYTMFNETGRITVVGDDDQTIYSWRGADAGLLLRFQKIFTRAETLTLSTCFRCPKHIIRAMSDVIKCNKKRVKKQIKAATEQTGINKIYVLGGSSQKIEATLVCDKIQEVMKHAGTIAILYRTRKQSEVIQEELKARAIKTSKAESAKDLDGKTAEIITNMLLFIGGRPYNQKVITDSLLKPIKKYMNVKTSDQIKTGLQQQSIKLAIDAIAEALNLHDPSLNVIISEAEKLDSSVGFGDFADEIKELEITDVGTGRVILTTVHQAKGLEWDNVFIIGASRNVWPSFRGVNRNDENEINEKCEEERRLFYVAMSRARKNLTISFSGRPSEFIGEINEIYTDLKYKQEDNNEKEEKEKERKKKEIKSFPGFVSSRNASFLSKSDSFDNNNYLKFTSASNAFEHHSHEEDKVEKYAPKLLLQEVKNQETSFKAVTPRKTLTIVETPLQTQPRNRVLGTNLMRRGMLRNSHPKGFVPPRKLNVQTIEEPK